MDHNKGLYWGDIAECGRCTGKRIQNDLSITRFTIRDKFSCCFVMVYFIHPRDIGGGRAREHFLLI